MRRREHTDVIVVGAGIAGAAAALELAAGDVEFMGIDKADRFGGTARRGGVGCSIAGSPLQLESGLSDGMPRAVDDLMANGNDADRTWARFYYRRAVADVYGWYRQLGVDFDGLLHFEGDSVARWHRPAGGGARVMEMARKKFAERGLEQCWHFGLTVTDLLRDGERICGVRIKTASGQRAKLRARAVILATGGFAGNLDMSRAASPQLRNAARLLAGGNPDSQGNLHTIAARHGACLSSMGNVYTYANGTPDYRDPSGKRGVVVRRVRSCVWVNRSGERFHDEDLHITGLSATGKLMRQDGQTCWIVLPEATLPEVEIFDHYIEPGSDSPAETVARFFSHSPFVSKAESLHGLAGKIGVDARTLEKTIADWNSLLSSGAARDPLTDRDLVGLRPLSDGPWCAIQLFPLVRKTLGGVATDLRCRVLDRSGAPIHGLFAAGELAGMGGGHLAGSRPLEGLMAGGSVFSGRIAGRWAARTLRTSAGRGQAMRERNAASSEMLTRTA